MYEIYRQNAKNDKRKKSSNSDSSGIIKQIFSLR